VPGFVQPVAIDGRGEGEGDTVTQLLLVAQANLTSKAFCTLLSTGAGCKF
jgi:hypothetical protein